MGSDMMPNEGTYFHVTEPEEQKQEENAERAKAQQGMEMLEELIARMENRITFYDSTKCIQVDIDTNLSRFKEAYQAAQMTKQNLIQEKEYMEGLRDKYKR
jgi:hypothetical protein